MSWHLGMANKITVIFLWLNGDNFIVFIYGRLIHSWVLCFKRSIDAFRLCTCLLMFFLLGFLLKWSICSAVILMLVLIFILLCHQVVWDIWAQDSSVSARSGRKMQFTKHDHFISNEFWYKLDISHLYIKDSPSLWLWLLYKAAGDLETPMWPFTGVLPW